MLILKVKFVIINKKNYLICYSFELLSHKKMKTEKDYIKKLNYVKFRKGRLLLIYLPKFNVVSSANSKIIDNFFVFISLYFKSKIILNS